MVELKNPVSNFGKVVANKISTVTGSRPKETKGTLYGIGYGAFAGILIGGGVSVAAFGGAVALPLIAVAAVTGGLIGNRAGIGQDKQALLNEIDYDTDTSQEDSNEE